MLAPSGVSRGARRGHAVSRGHPARAVSPHTPLDACKRAQAARGTSDLCARTHTMLARRTLGGCHHRATVTVRTGCMGMVAVRKAAHTCQHDLQMAATEVPAAAAPTTAPPTTRAPTAPPTFSPAGDPIGMPRAAAYLAGRPVAILRSSERWRVHASRPNLRARSSEGMAGITYFVQSCERENASAVHGA